MARLRLTLRLLAMALTLGGALIVHGLWRLVGAPSPWPRRFLGTIARLCGARARVVGTPAGGAVILSNHLSWLDILLLAGATGTTFVAKADLRAVPLVGWLCTLNDTIFVSREDRLGVAGQVERLREAIGESHRSVAIFPEGTTGDGTALLPFKAALLAALDPPLPGVRVQPVRIDYGDATGELAWVGGEPGQAHAARVLARPGHFTATLRFLEPFDPADYPGRKAIAAEARRRMEAAR